MICEVSFINSSITISIIFIQIADSVNQRHDSKLYDYFSKCLPIYAKIRAATWLHVWKNKTSVFKGISLVSHSQLLIRNDKKLTIKLGSVAQVFSVSITTGEQHIIVSRPDMWSINSREWLVHGWKYSPK